MAASRSTSGNAVVLVLIGVALFGALAYTFMRGAKQGQGNLTKQQAKIAAQELLDFLGTVEKATNKLRSRGCSESDISFANTGDTGPFVAANDPATAPSDGSCDIFNSSGGGLNFNMNWEKYQISLAEITQYAAGNENQYGNIYFRIGTASTVDVGTAANDLMMHLNFVQPEICRQFNLLQGYTITEVADNSAALGTVNTSYVGKPSVCRYTIVSGRVVLGQVRVIWSVR